MPKECDICHYWCFLEKGFNLEPYICNVFHNVLMMSVNLNDIAILNKSDVDYLCIRNGFNKRDAVNLLQNADLNEMRRVLQK